MTNAGRILPLYDPSHQPSSWNERMIAGEFAALFTGEHPETVNGVQTPDGAFCVVFSDLQSAVAYAGKVVVEYPKMICRIYDHRGMVGAPLHESAGTQANKSEISRKFRLWMGGSLTAIGVVLGLAEIISGFKLNWAGMLGSRIGPVGAILLLTEAAIALGAARERKRAKSQ